MSTLSSISRHLLRSARSRPLSRPFSSSTPSAAAYVRFIGPQKPQSRRTWETRTKVLAGVAVLGGCYYVSHLEQVPDTGRWRFMNMSPAYEAKLGEMLRKQAHEEFKSVTLPPTHPLSRHVHRVVGRLLKASNLGVIRGESNHLLSPFQAKNDSEEVGWDPDAYFGAGMTSNPVYGPDKAWDVIVVNDHKMLNAMANPGAIIVFTGILPVCQDEEGLAAVLAHEIGHVVARHTAERFSSQTVVRGLAFLFYSFFDIDFGITNFLQTYLMELPNSRTQEREADIIGLRLMSRACYDPAAAIQMFSRLDQIESKMSAKGLDFLRTHPSSGSRAKLLEEALPEGYAILEANPQCESVRQQLAAFRSTALPMKLAKDGEIVFM